MASTKDASAIHQESEKPTSENMGVHELSEKQLDNDAHQATSAEHNLTIRQAFKTYNRAVLWSILISTTVVMEGTKSRPRNHFSSETVADPHPLAL